MRASPRAKVCIHCIAEGLVNRRKANYPGPSCYSHRRRVTASQTLAKKDKYVFDTYGVTGEQYQEIYEAQGGVCALCRRAKGTGKYRLSVDHDHALAKLHDHPEDKGCIHCVRMLLCKPCNKFFGHLRDSPEAFERGAELLRNPPARKILERDLL